MEKATCTTRFARSANELRSSEMELGIIDGASAIDGASTIDGARCQVWS